MKDGRRIIGLSSFVFGLGFLASRLVRMPTVARLVYQRDQQRRAKAGQQRRQREHRREAKLGRQPAAQQRC